MYYTVIKHDRHLRTRGKRRKHEPQASVSYISRVFSNDWSVLLVPYDVDFTILRFNNKTRFLYVLFKVVL